MTLIDPNESAITGCEPIDQDHQEFIGLLNRLENIDNKDFPALFRQLYEHTEQHFERENELMTQYAFPALAEHKGEHQRVLGEFKQFQKRVDKGLIAFGRSFVTERLPEWFKLHVSTMDGALAAHIKTK